MAQSRWKPSEKQMVKGKLKCTKKKINKVINKSNHSSKF